MRDISQIIIHCSATPEGRDVSIDEIRKWHVEERGWSDIGYHYVIGLDGQIHKGRPVETQGAHCKGQNHNSIGICYVGGMDVAGKRPKDTRTKQQQQALMSLLRLLRDDYGVTEIHGHNEYSNKACPSFNVQTELKHPGGKPLAASKKARGAAAAAVGTTLSAVSEQIQPLIGYADILKWVFLALALGGIAFSVWAQLDDRKKRVVG